MSLEGNRRPPNEAWSETSLYSTTPVVLPSAFDLFCVLPLGFLSSLTFSKSPCPFPCFSHGRADKVQGSRMLGKGGCPPLTSIFPSSRGERRFEKSARRDGGTENGEGDGQALNAIEKLGEV